MQIVPHFYSTLFMNWISHIGLVSLYPFLTLDNQALLNSTSPQACILQQECQFELGVEFISHLPDKEPCHLSFQCPATIRNLFDDSVLWIPFVYFPTPNKFAKTTPNLVWKLNNNTCGDYGPGFTLGLGSTYGEVYPSILS